MVQCVLSRFQFTNRKFHMGLRLVPKLVTVNDLEWRNGSYFALFA